MWNLTSHTGSGRLLRAGREYSVSYDLEIGRTYGLRISGTVRAEMDAFPGRDELHVVELELENRQRLRVNLTRVDALKGTADFYVNSVNA